MKVTDTLIKAWRTPFTTRSDFAREYAEDIAAASSSGLITTSLGYGIFGNLWCITALGLAELDGPHKTQEHTFG